VNLHENENTNAGIWGAGAYFLGAVGAVIVLIFRRDPYCRFHAVQSIIATVVLFLLGLLLKGLAYLPIFGFLYGFLFQLFQIGVFALWVFLMYQGWKGREYKLPMIGAWAEEATGRAGGSEYADLSGSESHPSEEEGGSAGSGNE